MAERVSHSIVAARYSDNKQRAPSSAGALDALVEGMKHGFELVGCCVLLPVPPGGKSLCRETLGIDGGGGRNDNRRFIRL